MSNNNDRFGKKGGPGQAAAQASQTASTTKAPADNLFARHGNSQIQGVIQGAQTADKKPDSLLTSMVAEADQQGAEQQSAETAWWQDSDKEDEQTQLVASPESDGPEQQGGGMSAGVAAVLHARAVVQGKDPATIDLDKEAEKPVEQSEIEALERIEREARPGDDLEQLAILAVADAKQMSEADKAEMLGQGDNLRKRDVEGESGEVQSLLAAEQLPEQLAILDRKAAADSAKTPLDERTTLRNITEEIQMIAEQLHNHPTMMDPNASVESKATALIEALAYSLDVPTRESIAAHPFTVLTEDLIFDPRGMMEINRISGSRRDVRQLGSFAVILWQLTVNAAHLELDALGDSALINEQSFLSNMLNDMSDKMYTDAMAKPGW